MKRIRIISFLVVLWAGLHSCRQPACISSEERETFLVQLPPFKHVVFRRGIELHIQEGPSREMQVDIPASLKNEFSYEVINDTLELSLMKQCIFRDATKAVKVHLQTPVLQNLRNSSEYTVYSDGVWHFPHINLISENYADKGSPAVGDFDIETGNQKINIIANNLSVIKLKGHTHELNVSLYSRAPKIYARNLQADIIVVNHHSNSDIFLYPVNEIRGDIYARGNVYIYNRPPVIRVQEHWDGKLIVVQD